MKHLLVLPLLVLLVGCASERSVVIRRAPSDDLSVRRLYVVRSSTRLLGDREAIPNDPTAFITVDLVEYNGIVRAFHPIDPTGARCPTLWIPSIRASTIFPDHPNGDREGWFMGGCQGKGEVYDLDGSCFGGCPGGNLRGFPASIDGDMVRIHLPPETEQPTTPPTRQGKGSVVIPRSPSEDLSVRHFFVVAGRLLPEGQTPPTDGTARIGFDLVEHGGIVRAFQPSAPDRCTVRWKPDLRASDIFPDRPNSDRRGWFWGVCQGEVYDLDGSCFGACLAGNLREYSASIEGDQIRVHLPED